MTEEECKALNKGDVVYCRATYADTNNAVVETPSGLLRDVRLVPFTVLKVCKKVVTGHCSHGSPMLFADLISATDAQAAMDRYAEVQRDKAAKAARVRVAVERIERAGWSARTHYHEMQVAADVADVAIVERLADIIVTGSRALDIMAEVRAACPVTDAPMVTLHLSVEQAERAIKALKGATVEDDGRND